MRLLKVSALLVVVLFNAVLMLGIVSLYGLQARGGGGTPGATLNGDVNCDGKVDIADGIAIIQWQFTGGTAPCALAQDNFATKEDLNAIASRVAALEASARKSISIATGIYAGNRRYPRKITTGLTGKLREVTHFFGVGSFSSVNFPRLDTMGSEAASVNGITFSGPDFILDDPNWLELNRVSATKEQYTWVAISTPE